MKRLAIGMFAMFAFSQQPQPIKILMYNPNTQQSVYATLGPGLALLTIGTSPLSSGRCPCRVKISTCARAPLPAAPSWLRTGIAVLRTAADRRRGFCVPGSSHERILASVYSGLSL